MKTPATGIGLIAVLALCSNLAWAGNVLTFDGLKNLEPVGEYYNGGKGGMGTGPGPKYGITFSANGVAYIPGKQSGNVTPFPGDPSPPTVLLDFNMGTGAGQPVMTTMDITGGSSGALVFYYIAIGTKPKVQIYSGLDGGGMLLASQNFAVTGTELSNAVFSNAESIKFAGTARSVVFTGGNQQLALDNISFAAVPEPSGWISLATSLGCSYMILGRRRPKTPNRSAKHRTPTGPPPGAPRIS